MKSVLLSGLILLSSGILSPGRAAADSRPEPAAFETLHRLIVPSGDELAWQKIPWMIDLLAARREAARVGKPIFLWEMDGHPLGCT